MIELHCMDNLELMKTIEDNTVDLIYCDILYGTGRKFKDYQDLSGFYIFMIEANKKQFKKVFNIFLNHPYDCTLFNCSAGKDRTGVITALLFKLVGVPDIDISHTKYLEKASSNCIY